MSESPYVTPEYGVHPATHGVDPVVAALGELGTPVERLSTRSIGLEGPHVLWLVLDGAMDLFAVGTTRAGHWHHLGRLTPGTLLLGPTEGPEHTLVGRPLDGCRLRRIELHALPAPAPHDPYTGAAPGGPYAPDPYATAAYQSYDPHAYDPYGQPATPPAPSPLEDAFNRGVGRGLRVLYQAPLDGGGTSADPDPPAKPGRPDAHDDDILWMSLTPGSVRYGAAYQGHATGTLLIETATWQGMVDQQYRLLCALDRWIESLERDHADRAEAGIRAGRAASDRADEALLASIGPRGPRRTTGAADDDNTLAALRLVAREARIPLPEQPTTGPDADGTDPVERLARAARVRTREVRLTARWWRQNSGPLLGHRADDDSPVALLWRRGGYHVVDPHTGDTERVTAQTAADLHPRGVMLYRPLPDRPLGLLSLMRFSAHGTRPELRRLLVGALVAAALGALVPLTTGRVLGEYVPAGEADLIAPAALALVAAATVSAAFMLYQNTAVLRLEGRVEATLQPAVWDRLLRLPTNFFRGRSTGELASAALGVSAIRRVLSGIGTVCVQAGTVGLTNLVLLFWLSVPMALAALGILLVVAVTFLGLGLWQLRYQRKLVKLGNRLNNQAFQTLRGLPKLRVAAAESFAYAAWAKGFARTRELQQRIGHIRCVLAVLNAVYLPLCTLVMFLLLAGPARGGMTAAQFLTFSTAVTMLLGSATQLTGALLSAAAVQPMFELIRPILRAAPEVAHSSTPPGTLTGALEARGVSYRYGDDGPLVLEDVDLRVEPGEFVAIVGASGCGKSTLLRLLIGFDRPLTGSVHYDGQDLAALDQSAVRRQCGVVLQNSQPLTGSILDCIRGAAGHTLEEAWEAAELAGLADDIRAMPMGMHTMLSDGGGTVSGGQRQRLMIAQALVRKPRVLFLDEATSALDNAAQRVVMESTGRLRCTRIVIAHRLSTVLGADRIVAMADGRIVQQGTPTELLNATDGLFHDLVRRQLG
ncbi:NHLP bacteriocin export ABC transporter permease/ATPase subunit [Streptomyces sp. OF3]|uniref:NHLP bacteriocin export ABC transporter permease/ATPase subunit n=1 Tax=Streptomyces alkaliterrae TaxID=2213162 RepID=A0A7W3WQ04_9ACTN|nr:NHLP bacteriocin export ABC transporter permease/ATPase subunit [Streptomyces alkaliterrae]MBB1256304.1 NHLP bacteriocin export ABC transporter permease/ATPase subunit [Streptomyces alkaliterrae]